MTNNVWKFTPHLTPTSNHERTYRRTYIHRQYNIFAVIVHSCLTSRIQQDLGIKSHKSLWHTSWHKNQRINKKKCLEKKMMPINHFLLFAVTLHERQDGYHQPKTGDTTQNFHMAGKRQQIQKVALIISSKYIETYTIYYVQSNMDKLQMFLTLKSKVYINVVFLVSTYKGAANNFPFPSFMFTVTSAKLQHTKRQKFIAMTTKYPNHVWWYLHEVLQWDLVLLLVVNVQ